MKFNKILDVLYPRRCPVCGDITGGSGRMICPDCLHKLSFVRSPVCKKCGKEIEDGSLEFCPDCMRHPRAFEYGIALLNYDEAARHSMAQIKYNNKREYLDFYGTALDGQSAGCRQMPWSRCRSMPRGKRPGDSIRQRSWHGSSERSWGFR